MVVKKNMPFIVFEGGAVGWSIGGLFNVKRAERAPNFIRHGENEVLVRARLCPSQTLGCCEPMGLDLRNPLLSNIDII